MVDSLAGMHSMASSTIQEETPKDSYQSTIATPTIEETIASTELHATSEALNMLSHVAQLDAYATSGHPHPAEPLGVETAATPIHTIGSPRVESHGPLQYELVSRGLLTTSQVAQLVVR